MIEFNLFGYNLASGENEDTINYIFSSDRKLFPFLNANLVNELWHEKGIRERIQSSAVFLNDGVGIDIAANILLNIKLKNNLNGTDFLPFVLSYCAQHDLSVGFLGAKHAVVSKAAENAISRIKGLKLEYVQDGFDFILEEETALVAKLGIDVLFVGLGNPKQEMVGLYFSEKNRNLKVFTVGAFFDFYSNSITRAPYIIRKAKMEWFFRLIKEPSRLFKRYVIGNPLFLFRVLLLKLKGNG